jgi:hypothetical protein
MTNADWWARVVQVRTAREDLLPQRVWALRKGEHEARDRPQGVPGVGRRDRAEREGRDATHAAVPLSRAGRAGWRDRGHAGDVRGEGVDVIIDFGKIRRLERGGPIERLTAGL